MASEEALVTLEPVPYQGIASIHKFSLKKLADSVISSYLFYSAPPLMNLKKKPANIFTLKNIALLNKYIITQTTTPSSLHYPPWEIEPNTSMILEMENRKPSEIPKKFNDILMAPITTKLFTPVDPNTTTNQD